MHLIKILLLCALSVTANICNAQTKKKTSTKATTNSKKRTAAKPKAQTQNTIATTKPKSSGAKQNNGASNESKSKSNKVANRLGLGNGKHVAKGTSYLNAGIGFSNYGLPLHVSFDKLVVNDISVGIFANAQTYNAQVNFYDESHAIVHSGIKSNYYFNHILGIDDDQWSLAAGLSAGYWHYFYEGAASNLGWSKKGGIFLSSQIDLRYFFNKNWAILLHANYGGMNAGIVGFTYRP
jgi:outer membrane immunogenic protein